MREFRNAIRISLIAGGLVVFSAAALFAALPPDSDFRFISDGFPLALSVLGAYLGFRIYRREKNRGGARVWGWMALGLSCWAAGEIVWGIFTIVRGEEVPFPSIADLFWAAGYVPVVASLANQLFSLRVPLTRKWLTALGAVLAVMILLVIGLVVVPILADPETVPPLERFFDFYYPVGDVVLLSLGLSLGFVFLGGQLGLPWGVLAAGIFLDGLSDLLFSYGTWHGLYYPDGRLNILSAVFDVLYIGAYTVWDAGLFLRWRLSEPGREVDLTAFIPEAGKEFLVMVDHSGRVVFADPALTALQGLRKPGGALGKSFGAFLNLPKGFESAALHKAERTGLSDAYTVALGLSGARYRLRLVAASDPRQFPGFDILMHPESLPEDGPADREAILLGGVAERARRRQSLETDRLRTYCSTAIELLHILVSRAGGMGVGAAFEADLNRKARAKGFHFRLRDGLAEWKEEVTYPGLYRELLKEAIRYAAGVIAPETIAVKLREIEAHIDPGVLREAEENGLSARQWLAEGSE